MQTPTPSPAAPYVVAGHAGHVSPTAAVDELRRSQPDPASPVAVQDRLDLYRAQLAELEAHGRRVLLRFSPAQLATALYAAVYVSQLEGRLGDIELDPVEDLAALIQRAEHDDEQRRA